MAAVPGEPGADAQGPQGLAGARRGQARPGDRQAMSASPMSQGERRALLECVRKAGRLGSWLMLSLIARAGLRPGELVRILRAECPKKGERRLVVRIHAQHARRVEIRALELPQDLARELARYIASRGRW